MEKSFAAGLNFYKLFWIFFIGCFVGVVVETMWCFIRFHRIESRKGLIYGPLNLVYGFGALIITLLLSHTSQMRELWILIIGAFIGGAYEYICSYIQEKAFGSRSWDYSNFPLNLNGRITLLYCLFWGILAVVWVRDVYPFISSLIEQIPNSYGIILTWSCFAFIIFDSVISACAVFRMYERKIGIQATNKFQKFMDKKYNEEYRRKIYPNMQFIVLKDKCII